MTLKNKLAVGFAVFTMGGTAFASDASADRAAALAAMGRGTETRQSVAKKAAPTSDAPAHRPCDRKDCCAMNAPTPPPASLAPAFTDFG